MAEDNKTASSKKSGSKKTADQGVSGSKKRKATEPLTGPSSKNGKKASRVGSGNLQTQDESSSSSTASLSTTAKQTTTATTTTLSKSSKTAAIIAAVNTKQQQQQQQQKTVASAVSSVASTATVTQRQINSILNEEEVRKYLSRKQMTTKELLHKFRNKTKDIISNTELCQLLKTILDKMNAKMVERDGINYLSLP